MKIEVVRGPILDNLCVVRWSLYVVKYVMMLS